MTSVLRSGTYGLGSLRKSSKTLLPPLIGRGQYSKAERQARIAVFREMLAQRSSAWWRTPRSVKQLSVLYPDSYPSEILDVLKQLTAEGLLTRFMHGSRAFYRGTK